MDTRAEGHKQARSHLLASKTWDEQTLTATELSQCDKNKQKKGKKIFLFTPLGAN